MLSFKIRRIRAEKAAKISRPLRAGFLNRTLLFLLLLYLRLGLTYLACIG